jgi:mRNA interferase RelE/StbE
VRAIRFTPAAGRQFRKLPASVRERIVAKLRVYADMGAGDVTALSGRPGARLRVGDWRVVFVETPGEITVGSVAHRREAYR